MLLNMEALEYVAFKTIKNTILTETTTLREYLHPTEKATIMRVILMHSSHTLSDVVLPIDHRYETSGCCYNKKQQEFTGFLIGYVFCW